MRWFPVSMAVIGAVANFGLWWLDAQTPWTAWVWPLIAAVLTWRAHD